MTWEDFTAAMRTSNEAFAADSNPEIRNQNNNLLVEDSETKQFLDWYKRLDSSLSAETKDYLVQNYFNRQAEDRTFNRELWASSTGYQRAVKDLSAAGLNPFLALSNLGLGSTPSSNALSTSGGLFSGKSKQSMSSTTSAIVGVIGALALIAVKMLAK